MSIDHDFVADQFNDGAYNLPDFEVKVLRVVYGCNHISSCTNSYMGMWHSGSASALRVESLGFDSPHLQAGFEWSRVRFTLDASIGTY